MAQAKNAAAITHRISHCKSHGLKKCGSSQPIRYTQTPKSRGAAQQTATTISAGAASIGPQKRATAESSAKIEKTAKVKILVSRRGATTVGCAQLIRRHHGNVVRHSPSFIIITRLTRKRIYQPPTFGWGGEGGDEAVALPSFGLSSALRGADQSLLVRLWSQMFHLRPKNHTHKLQRQRHGRAAAIIGNNAPPDGRRKSIPANCNRKESRMQDDCQAPKKYETTRFSDVATIDRRVIS